MDHRFTFSIFTIDINGRPTLACKPSGIRTRNIFANTAG
jgi:hypothetical protein